MIKWNLFLVKKGIKKNVIDKSTNNFNVHLIFCENYSKLFKVEYSNILTFQMYMIIFMNIDSFY